MNFIRTKKVNRPKSRLLYVQTYTAWCIQTGVYIFTRCVFLPSSKCHFVLYVVPPRCHYIVIPIFTASTIYCIFTLYIIEMKMSISTIVDAILRAAAIQKSYVSFALYSHYDMDSSLRAYTEKKKTPRWLAIETAYINVIISSRFYISNFSILLSI